MGDGPAEVLVGGKVRHTGDTSAPQHRLPWRSGRDISCRIHPAKQGHTGKNEILAQNHT